MCGGRGEDEGCLKCLRPSTGCGGWGKQWRLDGLSAKEEKDKLSSLPLSDTGYNLVGVNKLGFARKLYFVNKVFFGPFFTLYFRTWSAGFYILNFRKAL
jgi:hypothetical protein